MKRFPLLVVLLVIFSALCSACARTSTPGSLAPMSNSQEEQITISDEDDYLIGKGDVLEISVWREPMLSGETIVRNDGMISLPLIGDVQAGGRTTLLVKKEVQERLKEFISEPVVTVMLRIPVSQKFYVLGEVNAPGEYDLVKDMNILQGIARAGGFTEWASKSRMLLLRKENGHEKRIPINYNDIVRGRDLGQNLPLRADDTLVVP